MKKKRDELGEAWREVEEMRKAIEKAEAVVERMKAEAVERMKAIRRMMEGKG